MMPAPSPDFASRVVDPPTRLHRLRKPTRPLPVFGTSLEDKVAEGTPFAQIDARALFAYLHRRFGPPNQGNDPEWSISGSWLLRSPEDDVLVEVLPGSDLPCWTFQVQLTWDPGDEPVSLAQQERIAGAYRTVLLDLLRPVRIREELVDALGDVPDDSIPEGDPDGLEVDRSPAAGTGIPAGIVGTPAWRRLIAVARLESGDAAKGIEALVERRSREILRSLLGEAFGIQVLVGLYLENTDAVDFRPGTDVREAVAAVRSFLDGNAHLNERVAFLGEEADVRRSALILAALGVPNDLSAVAKRIAYAGRKSALVS